MTSSFISYLLGYFSVNCTSAAVLWTAWNCGRINGTDAVLFFLLYGFLSCICQLPLGLVSDKFKLNGRYFAAAGCIICAMGPVLYDLYMPLPSAVALAVGSAVFVVGAGTDSLTQNTGYTRCGIFFASGAIGTAFGIKISGIDFFPSLYTVLALLLSALLVFFFCRHTRGSFELFMPEKESGTARPALLSQKYAVVFLTAVTVLARSWSSMAVTAADSESSFDWLLPSAALAAGIFAGGIAADLFTPDVLTSAAFFAASLAVTQADGSYLFYLAFLFFCGVTVPVSLGNLTQLKKGAEGLALGIFSSCIIAGEFAARVSTPAADSITARYGISAVLLACAVLSFICCPRVRTAKTADVSK